MILESLLLIFKYLLAFLGGFTVIVAIKQLLEAQHQRAAAMSWSLYKTYSSEEMEVAKKTLYLIKDEFSNAEEYKAKFHDQELGSEAKTQDRKILFRLRFFHQAGLLVKKRLVDADLLFGLVGQGLKTDYNLLGIIAESHRRAHLSPLMFDHFEYLYNRYLKWEASKQKK